MKPLIFLLLIGSLLLGGCKKDIQNEEAVRQGIMKHLSQRGDLTSMDVTVTKVAFRQNEADATVRFQAKGSTAPGASLEMDYILERRGNEWVVKGRASGSHGSGMPGGQNPHGMGAPAGAMPGSLPPGHPALPPSGAQKSTQPPGQAK